MNFSTRCGIQVEPEYSNNTALHLESAYPTSREDLVSFSALLKVSKRIAALLGAGLSASSGMPTFRGAGSTWRGLPPSELSSPHCLEKDPVLFWHFFNYRRHLALQSNPNPGHDALARLAGVKDFLAISQNIDGGQSPKQFCLAID